MSLIGNSIRPGDHSLVMGQEGGGEGLEDRGGGLKKINLFHQIILVKRINILEYLVLM